MVCLAFHPDGNRLARLGQDPAVKIRDVRPGGEGPGR